MKGRIMTWDEFRQMCEMDAQNWYYRGYTTEELAMEYIIDEYDVSFFRDSTTDYHDELSSCFTPKEIAVATLAYLDLINIEMRH